MFIILNNINKLIFMSYILHESYEDKDETEENLQEMILKYNTLPWIEKYRPSTLDKVISHNNIIKTLKIFIKNRCLPHLLFYGPPGTGKTSIITACAKELYGEYYEFMVMELNASDDRGIEIVRNKIKQFVSSKSVFFGKNVNERNDIFKLVILDETDAMTADAQAILRKVVEQYTNNTRFCLICNYIQNINPALQSRCTKFRFPPLRDEEIKKKVLEIIKEEKIKVTKSGLNTLLKIANGDMRKVVNNLQSTSMAYNVVNEDSVYDCLGYPKPLQIKTILKSIIDLSYSDAFEKIYNIKLQNGLSLDDIIIEIHSILVQIILGNNKDFEFINFEQKKIMKILDKLRDIEYNNSINTSEDIQLGALIGVFKFN